MTGVPDEDAAAEDDDVEVDVEAAAARHLVGDEGAHPLEEEEGAQAIRGEQRGGEDEQLVLLAGREFHGGRLQQETCQMLRAFAPLAQALPQEGA